MQTRLVELDLAVEEKIGNSVHNNDIDHALIGLYPEVPDDVFLPDNNEDGDHEPVDGADTLVRQMMSRRRLMMSISRQRSCSRTWVR